MLYIVATPIGNLEDISLRALRILKEADVILTEDTRRTGLLLKHFAISHQPFISFYENVESQKMEELLALAASDQKVALVSDAGTPLVSDPGYKLVREALKMGIRVESLPGPVAAVVALTMSGLPPDKFLFMGYPPEKQSHQLQLLNSLKLLNFGVTIIFYVSPHKLIRFLNNLNPNLEIVVCRELTKVYEERWTGIVSDALVKFKQPKGELVILWHS